LIELNAENVYNYLITIANSSKNTIRYKEMEEICGLEHNPKNLQQLTDVLNLIVVYNKLKGEPFLAALVINKHGMPGDGFIRTLNFVNVDVGDKIAFFVKEIQRIRNHKWEKWNWNITN
jgi:hypothetical protein